MIIYCYRSGQIGFALREIPDGAIAIAKGPHPITEAAVHGCARLAYDNETWLVPGIPEAANEEAAYQAMLTFEKRLKDRIAVLKKARDTEMLRSPASGPRKQRILADNARAYLQALTSRHDSGVTV